MLKADIVGRLTSFATSVPVLTSIGKTSYAAARLADENVEPWKPEFARLVDGRTARHMTTVVKCSEFAS